MSDVTPPPPPPPAAYPPSYPQPSQGPSNNLALAIITTILCCLPLGIYAIVKAAEVNGKWAAGDYMGAQASADAAKKFSIIGIVIGAVGVVLYIGLIAAGAFSASTY